MDEKELDNVAAFDLLFTTNQIQILKAIFPFFPLYMQKYLAIFIKYQELQYTMTLLHRPYKNPFPATTLNENSLTAIITSVFPYCSETQKKNLQQIQEMLQSFTSYREMMELMELMKEMRSADESASSSEASFNENNAFFDMNTLLSLLSPEQQELFTLFHLINGGNENDTI